MATKALSESRKADRAAMAAGVKALCADLGASCDVIDHATHVYCDGSRSSNRNRIVCQIACGPARVGVEFNGEATRATCNTYCLAWHMDSHDDSARYASAFGSSQRGSPINQFHRRKCTAFAYGYADLLDMLRAGLTLCRSGEAFMAAEPLEHAVRG